MILFASNPDPLRRRLTVANDTGCGSNSLAFLAASTAVLRTPRFIFILRNSTVSVGIFVGRPPLFEGMFSLLLEYIRLAEDGEIPSRCAVSRVE